MKKQIREQKLLITQADFRTIIGDDWEVFQEKILHNCHCHACDSSYSSAIVDYTTEINDLNDIILHGKCAACGGPINRYLETGENKNQVKRVEGIRTRNSVVVKIHTN